MKKQDKSSERILIFGNGQIGNFYFSYFKKRGATAKVSLVDMTVMSDVKTEVAAFRPTVVINAAGKTDLEWCVNNKLEAFRINVLGSNNLAEICDEEGIYFIHLSSGCILESKDENDIKKEEATPHPTSYYSWTKVWAENLIWFKKSKNFKCLILRPRQPVSGQVSNKNMLVKMLTFTRFIDTPNNGTVLEDLMVWTDKLIKKRVTGVVHAANEGWTTPYDIAQLLRKYILPDLPIIKINDKQLEKMTPEKRVAAILDVSKLKSLVGEVKPYRERMVEIVKLLAKNLKKEDPKKVREILEKTVARSKARTIVNDVWPQLIRK